ncbi:MAG: hypothetical protein WCB27_24410 [Thermoguttaceae bacterium]
MFRAHLRLLIVMALLATTLVPTAEAGVLDANVMKVVLRAGIPREQDFIDYVVARVDKGTLPLDLVQSTFLWARKKPRKKFYYFKQALILRAADRGIHLRDAP